MLRAIFLSLALIVSCQNVYQVTFQNAATCPAPANMLISVIYSQTNNPAGNMLLSFAHYSNGLMAPTSSSTGGMGSVSGLGSQGSVVLDPSGRWLYSVDGGSNSIAAFNVAPNTGALTLAKSFSTNGTNPRSLSIYGNRLFALFNTSVQAFTIADDGSLSFMANWPLNISSNPAQVAVTLSGMVVIVTEKNTNMITTFAFDSNTSSYRGPMSFPSSGQTPFGFSLNQAGNILYVTEAAGGAAGASSLSSYWIYPNGTLVPISRSVATTQTSACWAVTIGNIVYASNPSSNSISSFMSTSSGTLTLKYAQAGTFPSPVEMVASQNGRMLYVAGGTPTNRTIGAFAVNSDSSLSMVTQSPPFSANNPAGLAIY